MIDRAGDGAAADGAFTLLSRLLEARTGQQLAPSRRWRIEAAITPLLQDGSTGSLDELVTRLVSSNEPQLADRVVELLLNNETSFFRDAAMFDHLDRDVLDALRLANATTRRLRIWSAACSTGQEAYSLAMMFLDNAKRWAGWSVEIVGSDVSASAVAQAAAGRYSSFEIQRGLPVRTMLRWFEQDGNDWVALPELRRTVRFSRHNLLDIMPGRFDLVLCRNALMYMPVASRTRVFDRLAEAIEPGGLLVLGAGETVIGQTDRFATNGTMRGTYMKTATNHQDVRRGSTSPKRSVSR